MSEKTSKPKRNRANNSLKAERVRAVLTLISHGYDDSEIVDALTRQEGIHPKTAKGYVKKARGAVGALGNNPTREGVGELELCLKNIQKQELSKPEPDLNLVNNIIGNRIKLLKHKPNHTKGDHHDYSPPTGQSISPELEAVIQELEDAAETEEPEGDK